MANPPKQKGTGGEREVLRAALDKGLEAGRTPASSTFDIFVRGSTGRTVRVLATRPNQGRWLATIPLEDLLHLLSQHGDNAEIEVKRYAKFAHHTIYDKKFGPEL